MLEVSVFVIQPNLRSIHIGRSYLYVLLTRCSPSRRSLLLIVSCISSSQAACVYTRPRPPRHSCARPIHLYDKPHSDFCAPVSVTQTANSVFITISIKAIVPYQTLIAITVIALSAYIIPPLSHPSYPHSPSHNVHNNLGSLSFHAYNRQTSPKGTHMLHVSNTPISHAQQTVTCI